MLADCRSWRGASSPRRKRSSPLTLTSIMSPSVICGLPDRLFCSACPWLHRVAAGWFIAFLFVLPTWAQESLTPIRTIRTLPEERLATSPEFHLRGVLTHRYADNRSFILQDDSDSTYASIAEGGGGIPDEA